MEYVTIKKYRKIYSVNPLYLRFGKVNGYFEEVNENKYLTLVPTDKNKEKINKYKELLIIIKNLISSITKKLDDYVEKYKKIKFDSDDNLPLYKTIEMVKVTIDIRVVFHENNKHYSQVILDEYLYKI